MIKRYKCITAGNADALTSAVQEEVDEGWQPFGAVTFDATNGKLVQAVIRGTPDNNVRVTNPSARRADAEFAAKAPSPPSDPYPLPQADQSQA